MSICYFNDPHLIVSDAVDEGDMLLIPALLSQTGAYPDKGISFSTADFDRAIARFSPVAINYEHKSGPLDGRLGLLQSIYRQGEALFGNIRAPKWLLQALRGPSGERPKLSAEWELSGKLLNGLAWTSNPRIDGAGLIAAFSAATRASAATFAKSGKEAFAHYFNGTLLHPDYVSKLKKHWNLEANCRPGQTPDDQMRETLKYLECVGDGNRIFESIVNPAATKGK